MGLLGCSAWGESRTSLSYEQLLQLHFSYCHTAWGCENSQDWGKCRVQMRAWGMSNYKTLHQQGQFQDFYNLLPLEVSASQPTTSEGQLG